MRHGAIALLILALLCAPAWAQAKVEVTGDSFVVDEASGQSVFSGNVVVVHPSVTVRAEKVVVHYGAGGPSNIESFTATGNVRLKTPDQTATGDKATFDPTTQLLRLTGNVVVNNASGTLNAPELVVDLKNNTSTFTGTTGGRVTGVFTAP